jgi:hypothetical protein
VKSPSGLGVLRASYFWTLKRAEARAPSPYYASLNNFQTESLLMLVAGIGSKPLFATAAFPLTAFHKTPPKAAMLAQLKNQKINHLSWRNSEPDAGWILQPHAERASCLHYMARSRRQGCAPLNPSPPP